MIHVCVDDDYAENMAVHMMMGLHVPSLNLMSACVICIAITEPQ